ncbi:LysR substrate-binding domain-containing protein [Lentzea sp. HUAS12]|uniref:LysR substrate-binding domain-containing protein n=1 Tax=Lentzea sp. HUAS12 TaxID=2951806 RepID=UPI00209DE96D|nr:LysR substrate-binding domain-containing protein [Lentzea sp. HUAS12]USX53469.1 LysR substrate-binding domain-containing protein [Lentzea sp. HUAS12]
MRGRVRGPGVPGLALAPRVAGSQRPGDQHGAVERPATPSLARTLRGGAIAGRTSVHVDELAEVPWIASPSSGAEPLLGVWPGLGRARVVHAARDWLTKLHLVAGGFGVTTIPARFSALVPAGVTSLRVEGAPPEVRRVLVAHLPGAATPAVAAVVEAITASFRP